MEPWLADNSSQDQAHQTVRGMEECSLQVPCAAGSMLLGFVSWTRLNSRHIARA